MNLLRSAWLLGAVGSVLLACSGESSDFSKGDGDTGTGGSVGGTTSKGGTTGKGGAPSGGATATGGSGGRATDPPDGICEDITPCGGDPQGTWNIRESCFELLVPIFPDQPGCEDVLAGATADVSGTFTFDNGALSSTLTTGIRLAFTIDDACAQGMVGSPDVTAADLCPLVSAQLATNPDTPGTCAVATGGCRCDVAAAPMTETNTGTYTIAGNQLVDETGAAIDFCQRDDELHLHSDAIDAGTSSLGGLTLLMDRVL